MAGQLSHVTFFFIYMVKLLDVGILYVTCEWFSNHLPCRIKAYIKAFGISIDETKIRKRHQY